MRIAPRPVPIVASLILLAGCASEPEDEATDFASPETDLGTAEIPLSTESEEARAHFELGQAALDLGRMFAAREYFQQAVAADPTFAIANLSLAVTAASPEELRVGLERAAELADLASVGEGLLIRIAELGFRNDLEGQLGAAEALVELHPNSPRARLSLATVRAGLRRTGGERNALSSALRIDPDFVPAHLALSNSYLFAAPRDPREAETHARRAADLVPEESQPHESLGDALRGQNRLEEARVAYERAAELDPEDGIPLLKIGHVESFLGNYDEARAAYDRAIELARDGQRAAFANFRAFTHLHARDPGTAIDALGAIVDSIEEIGVPEAEGAGQKINALTNVATIALHHGLLMVAEMALAERTTLMRERIARVGAEVFRRQQEANIAFMEGMLAARQGDFAGARERAAEFERLVEPDDNPRKLEPGHELLGLISLLEGNTAEAILHYSRADLQSDVCNSFRLALAHEAAGNSAEARILFRDVAEYNFNSVCFAMLRRAANQKLL